MRRAKDRPRHATGAALAVILLCIFWLAPPAWGVEINGTRYLALHDIAGKLGMKARWIEKDRVLGLSSQWTRMTFERHKREFELNGNRVHLGFPVAEHRGKLHLSDQDFRHTIEPILTPQLFGRPPGLTHIVVDAGHGGSDPGARNLQLKLTEKHLTLDLAKRLKRQLQAAGYRVSLTREADEFIALEERCRLASARGGDLFLSLHFNATTKTDVSGVETFAFTPRLQPSTARTVLHSSDMKTYPGNANDPWNTLLGYYVQRSLAAGLGVPDRGLKRARFAVLRDLSMPGILVEGGFVSNPSEGRNIGSAAYRDRIAAAIVDGVQSWHRTTERLSQSRP